MSSIFFCLLHNYLKLPGMAIALSYSLFRKEVMGTQQTVFDDICAALGIIAGLLTVIGYFLLVGVLGSLLLQTH